MGLHGEPATGQGATFGCAHAAGLRTQVHLPAPKPFRKGVPSALIGLNSPGLTRNTVRSWNASSATDTMRLPPKPKSTSCVAPKKAPIAISVILFDYSHSDLSFPMCFRDGIRVRLWPSKSSMATLTRPSNLAALSVPFMVK